MRLRLTLCALAGAACLLDANASAVGDGGLSALLKHQTQAFSDASQTGDTAAMNALVDDQVLFSSGNGTVDGTGDAAKDPVSALLRKKTQAFLEARQRGDTAVMKSYFDDAALFTNEDGVVSGPHDLRIGASAVPAKDASFTITVSEWALHHAGDVAVASFIDDRAVRCGGQVLDDRFRAVETWFKRGATWKLVGSQAIPLPQDPAAVSLPSDELDEYAGTYTSAAGTRVVVSRNGDALTALPDGGKAIALAAETRDVFFAPGAAGARRIFQHDASGHVTGYVSRTAGGDVAFTKADPAAAAASAAPPPQPISSSITVTRWVVHVFGDLAIGSFVDDKVTRFPGDIVSNPKFRSTESWIKRGAAWKMIASQTLTLQPEPPAVTLSPDELNDYIGTYGIGSGIRVTITRDGTALASSVNGGKAVPFEAEVRDVFFTPGSPGSRDIFQRDPSGRVTGFLHRRDGRDLIYSRVG